MLLAGIINACGKAAAAVKGATKIALGQNPMSPFLLMNLLGQFYAPGGAGEARSEGQSSNRSSSIADNVNRMAAAQSSRPPPRQ